MLDAGNRIRIPVFENGVITFKILNFCTKYFYGRASLVYREPRDGEGLYILDKADHVREIFARAFA